MTLRRQSQQKTQFLVRFSLLMAIEAIFCFTPLGSIPLGPLVATLAMLPIIVTALLMGVKAGTMMGFCAGLFSFLKWTFAPSSPIAFVFTPFYSMGDISGNFWSLVICFVPRILVGTVTALCFQAFSKLNIKSSAKNFLQYGLSACLGSLVNTFGVLSGIFIFFGRDYAQALGILYEAVIGVIGLTVLTNGIPEAILSTLVGLFVCQPIRKHLMKK